VLNRRSLFSLFALLFAVLMVACGPSWRVVRQSNPNPLAGATKFAVEPVHYEALTIGGKSDAEYTMGKEEKERASWQEDKRATGVEFTTALQQNGAGMQIGGGPPPDNQTFTVRASVVFWEPGFYALAARNSEMRMNIQILGPQGVIDEIEVPVMIASNIYNPSTGGRMRSAGKRVGAILADYLRRRTAG
jgi:hypothetical protein